MIIKVSNFSYEDIFDIIIIFSFIFWGGGLVMEIDEGQTAETPQQR